MADITMCLTKECPSQLPRPEGRGFSRNMMNNWLVVLNLNSDDPSVVYETEDFQAAVDKCNHLVKLFDKDYCVCLREVFEADDYYKCLNEVYGSNERLSKIR